MTKIKEYAKAIGAWASTFVLGVVAAATDAVQTELPGVKAAVAGLIVAVVVAVTKNLKPAEPPA